MGKLAVGAAVLALATVYLAFLGASASWRYYVLVDECVHDRDALLDRPLRVSGRIAAGTLVVSPDRSRASFTLHGAAAALHVACQGPLPDNLAEDMDVVVEGTLQHGGVLKGDKVLTRCASKYQADKESQ